MVGAVAGGVGFIINHYQTRENMRKKNNVMQRGYYIFLIIGGTLFVIGIIIIAAAVGLVNLLADIHTLFVQRSNFWI